MNFLYNLSMAEITEIQNKRLQVRLDERYAAQVTALKDLGFFHLAYAAEVHGPFSAFRMFNFIFPALQHGEILHFPWPFRLASANLLMETPNPPTIALCMGLGTKFYTIYEDGSIILSTGFHSRRVPKPGSKFTKVPTQATLARTWNLHKEEAMNRAGQIDFLSPTARFGDYVLASAFEEDPTQFDFV